MPNIEDKLFNLLCESEYMDWDSKVAYLIANGATVQKWIPVTERLPERDDMVIAFYPTMCGTSGEMQIHKAWAMSETCTHWMPLPPAPEDLK